MSGRLRYTKAELEQVGLLRKEPGQESRTEKVQDMDNVQTGKNRLKSTQEERKQEKAKKETGTNPSTPTDAGKKRTERYGKRKMKTSDWKRRTR